MPDNRSSSLENQEQEEHGMPLAYRAVRSGLWVASASYWTIAFGFLANIFLTRLLAPTYYGDFALATFFFSLLQLRGKFGLTYAFAQLPEGDKSAISTYVVVDVVLGLLSVVLIAAAAVPLAYFGYSSVVIGLAIVMALLSLVESFGSIFNTVLSKQLWSKPGSVIVSIALPLSYLAAFGLALSGQGQWSLIIQYAGMILLTQGGFWVFGWWRLRPIVQFKWEFRWSTLRKLVSFGGLVGISAFIGLMGTQVDNFYLGTFSSTEALGFYDRAYRTAQWPTLLLSALIANSAYFTYNKLQDDSIRLQKTVSMMFWISANLAVPISLILLISAPDLIVAAYGERWLPAAPLLRVLVLVSVIRPIWDNAAALFTAVGKPTRTILMLGVQLGVLAILGGPLTIRYGAMGTAVAVCLSFFCALLPLYWSMRQIAHARTLTVYGVPLLAAGLTLGGYAVSGQFIQIEDISIWLRLIVKIAYSLIAFFGFLWLLQPKETSERLAYIVRLVRS
jgi:PST family polysaccharide transporter